MTAYLFVLIVGFVAGAVSGIIGTGAAIMLLPILVYAFGPIEAVPIMAVAAVMANLARVLAWWSIIEWKAVAAYAISGLPFAVLGAHTLLTLDPALINMCLGTFFIVMVPVRHYLARRQYRLKLWQLGLSGAFIGFFTGLVLSTGPLSVPAFTAYGLTKGAFIGTEAASSFILYVGKLATFGSMDALPWSVLLQGLLVGSSLMAGTFAGKKFLLHLSDRHFQRLLDALLICSGLSLLWQALGY